jgi:general secretion pathway protein C
MLPPLVLIFALGLSSGPTCSSPTCTLTASDALAHAIRRVGTHRYAVKRELFAEILNRQDALSSCARIVPAFKDGVGYGFKLFCIHPGSIYSQGGLENGDVIERINGLDLTTPDKAFELYQSLRDAKEVYVDLDRKGKQIVMHYLID